MTVKVVLDSDVVPGVGDTVEIYTLLPDIQEEATVAMGRVSQASREFVLVTIDRATGRVAAGQLVRITPQTGAPNPEPSTKAPATAAADGGQSRAGADLLGALVRSFADGLGGGRRRTGSGWLGAFGRSVSDTVAREANLSRAAGALLWAVDPARLPRRRGSCRGTS